MAITAATILVQPAVLLWALPRHESVASLSAMLPVVAIAWLHGLWPGLAYCLIAHLLNPGLLATLGVGVPQTLFGHEQGLVAATVVAIVVGLDIRMWGRLARQGRALDKEHRSAHSEHQRSLRLEVSLQAREDHLRGVISSAPVVILATDRDGIIELAEGRGLPSLSVNPAELLGKSVSVFADTLPGAQADLRRALAGETVAAELTIPSTGATFDVQYAPLRDAAGAIRGALAVGIDVTERRQAESELRRQTALYRSVLLAHDSLGVSVVISRGTTPSEWGRKVLYRSPAFAALTGYSEAELAGIASLWNLVPEESQAELRARFGERVVTDIHLELPVRRKDGEYRRVELSIHVIADAAEPGMVLLGRDVTERDRAQRALAHQALHDALTGLPNRLLLADRLAQALLARERDEAPLALLLMDLDRFKEVNDTFGHSAGDQLLREVATRLRAELRDADTVARLGGDEFAFLLPGADHARAVIAARRLVKAFERPFLFQDQAVDLGASVGIALFPEHGRQGDELLRRADVAMYVAKRSGSGYAAWEASLDEHSPSRLGLVAELRRALDEDQLVLHFQPQLCLETGAVVGAEALARWNHPCLGLVGPGEFVPLAERTGLIRPLTEWVLTNALRACRRWRARGLLVPVAVNLSIRDLLDPRLPAHLADVLAVEGADPSWLVMEITESVVMADPARVIAILERLREMGIRLSVDDFGTGYSSLAYLHRLPVHEVKVDKSFVGDLTGAGGGIPILRAIIELGHGLGFTVIAEGVEDTQTLDRLSSLGCDRVQGFHLCPPLAHDAFVEWLEAREAVPPARATGT